MSFPHRVEADAPAGNTNENNYHVAPHEHPSTNNMNADAHHDGDVEDTNEDIGADDRANTHHTTDDMDPSDANTTIGDTSAEKGHHPTDELEEALMMDMHSARQQLITSMLARCDEITAKITKMTELTAEVEELKANIKDIEGRLGALKAQKAQTGV